MASTSDVAVDSATAGELPPGVASGRRRRRPSGEPPPLPRQLHRSGKYWVAVAGVVLVSGVAAITAEDIGIGIYVAD